MPTNIETFEQKLNAFVFFHLGANAICKIEQKVSALAVTVQHPRVHPFSFQIDHQRLAGMLEDHQDFEDFMLEQLIRHRKSH